MNSMKTSNNKENKSVSNSYTFSYSVGMTICMVLILYCTLEEAWNSMTIGLFIAALIVASISFWRGYLIKHRE